MMDMRVVIDRFEGDRAVLLFDDDSQASWPRSQLPSEAREGDHLRISITIDAAATKQAQAEAEELLKQLLEKNNLD